MWTCISSACASRSGNDGGATPSATAKKTDREGTEHAAVPGAVFATGAGPDPEAEADADASSSLLSMRPTLEVHELPTHALEPLHLHCSRCQLRMVPCECCHGLLAADKEVDGVLLCQRCGFLTILDPKLRGLVGIEPFSRAIVNAIRPGFRDVDVLSAQWLEWERRVLADAQQPPSSLLSPQGPTDTTPSQKKRRRAERGLSAASQDLGDAPPATPTAMGALTVGNIPADLREEGKHLHLRLKAARRNWQQLLDAAAAESTNPNCQRLQQQSFSSTHLNILRIMYEKTMEKAELVELTTEIEQFLLHQSTVVKAKYDLLSGLRKWHQARELETIAGGMQSAPTRAARVMLRCVGSQLQGRTSEFDKMARSYLRLVGIANKHLFALYNAAQGLSKMQLGSTGTPAADSSSLSGTPVIGSRRFQPEYSRSRRLYGGGGSSMIHMGNQGDDISLVQQSIEMRNRITEISKKVELWRCLSYTIASTCVLSLVELAHVAGGSTF